MFHSLGVFCARRHRRVLAVFGVLFIVLTAVGVGAFGSLLAGGQTDPNAPSSRAEALVDSHFGGEQQLLVLVTADHGSVHGAATAAVGREVTRVLSADDQIGHITSYFSHPSAALRSTDGRSALVLAHVRGTGTQVGDRTKTLIPRLAALGGSASTVKVGGTSAADSEITAQVGKDLLLVSIVAVPITVILLFFAFGSLSAALLPLGLAVLAIMGTFAELKTLTTVTSVSTYAIDLTIALGLGLAVDYSLLVINRYREELSRGADIQEAIGRSMATAGRTIVFSALTVALSLTALLVFPLYFLQSFAYAGIAVVAFAVVGALLLLPALLAAFGPRLTLRKHGREADAASNRSVESPFWRRLTTAVTARPLRSALPVLAVLVVVGTPFLHVRFSTPDDRVLPTTASAHQVGNALQSMFRSDASSTLLVVAVGDGSTTAEADYAKQLSKLPNVTAVQGATGTAAGGQQTTPATPGYAHGNLTYWNVDTNLPSTSGPAQTLVKQVRAVPTPAGDHVQVGGDAADLVDQKHSIGSKLPLAGAIIVIATFLILFLFTGSILIPLKALVLNAISLFAVIGLMVWIFQGGHLSGLLGFTPTPTSTTIPPLLFVVAFGLSMDYEVFLLSRIKELHENGASNTEAVIGGLARTGRIVTTAAALLSVTFFAFGLSKISFIQLFGLGTGIAILLDATVVRGVLVPAVMRLAGERIWWCPAPLRRLYRHIGISEDPRRPV